MRTSFSSTDFTPDRLVVEMEHGKKGTILSGGGALTRGTLLGKVTIGAATVTPKVGNTGTGALTMDATTPILANAQVGRYTVRCTAAAGNAGTMTVLDPKGNILGTHTVAGAAFANQIKFAVADATDFIVGDEIYVDVAAGSGKYLKSLTAAVDGTQYPNAILAEDVDATSADKEAMVYTSGVFNSGAMTFGTGHTAASAHEALRALDIHLVTELAA